MPILREEARCASFVFTSAIPSPFCRQARLAKAPPTRKRSGTAKVQACARNTRAGLVASGRQANISPVSKVANTPPATMINADGSVRREPVCSLNRLRMGLYFALISQVRILEFVGIRTCKPLMLIIVFEFIG